MTTTTRMQTASRPGIGTQIDDPAASANRTLASPHMAAVIAESRAQLAPWRDSPAVAALGERLCIC